jgi:predicted DNA-binding transcriptional regulator YafY
MRIIDSVRNNKFYRQILEGLSEEERKFIEDETESLVSNLQSIADDIRSQLLDEEGRKALLESLDEIMPDKEA